MTAIAHSYNTPTTMAASPLFLCLSVTLLAASLSVEGQEDLSQLREDMAAYRQQLEDMRHEMEAQRHEMEAQRHEMDLQRKKTEVERHEMDTHLWAQRERESEMMRQITEYQQQLVDMRNEMDSQRQRETELRKQLKKVTDALQNQEGQIQILQETCLPDSAGDADNGTTRVPAAADLQSHSQKNANKRSDDVGALEPVLSEVTQTLNVVTADVQALKNSNTGSVYVRWGSTSCPAGLETVYSGYIGGAYYTAGSAANYLCLPPNPVFDDHPPPRYGVTHLYGAEYSTCDEPECDMSAACSVCRTPRQAQVMVPGTNVCQDGWHLEYSGYLMAQRPMDTASEYICVDRSRGYIQGTQGNENGRVLYYTVVHCDSLSCPPYVDNKVVSCAVCSK